MPHLAQEVGPQAVVVEAPQRILGRRAGPLGQLETDYFGPETPPGEGRELIPLFQAVYHDVGPVHEDGWITLAEKEGSFFYFVAARIALVWGGILSLQYCTVPPEAFAGQDAATPAETILWDAALVRWSTFPTGWRFCTWGRWSS